MVFSSNQFKLWGVPEEVEGRRWCHASQIAYLPDFIIFRSSAFPVAQEGAKVESAET
jgi:hypothetical protein